MLAYLFAMLLLVFAHVRCRLLRQSWLWVSAARCVKGHMACLEPLLVATFSRI